MKELLERLGVPNESWAVSAFAAMLIVFYRIFDSENPLSARKTMRLVVIGFVCILLVPGVLVYVLRISNPFATGVLTALSVYAFEPLMEILKNRFLKKVNDGNA